MLAVDDEEANLTVLEGDDRKRLVNWIDEHHPAEATVDNGDGTLTVAVTCCHQNGSRTVDRSSIP
ncbi:hypothetical protein SB717_37020, partial [Priestia sp. SIMBA_032]